MADKVLKIGGASYNGRTKYIKMSCAADGSMISLGGGQRRKASN